VQWPSDTLNIVLKKNNCYVDKIIRSDTIKQINIQEYFYANALSNLHFSSVFLFGPFTGTNDEYNPMLS